MSLTLMYITNNIDVALIAEKNGVERIWIDLETIGKEERQKGMNTVKSQHCIEDIKKIKPLLSTSQLMVRINPWNNNSKREIESVIEAGADLIMLPMWKTVKEVVEFVQTVNYRCRTMLLLETKEAVDCIEKIVKCNGIDEIHIGLNDLHLSYNLTFMFELLVNGTVEKICNVIKKAGIPSGIGGIAKLGAGDLPAEKIIMEHYRLGSTRAILSRSFCNTQIITRIEDIEETFMNNMLSLREYEKEIMKCTQEDLIKNQENVAEIVHSIVEEKGGN